MSTPRPYVIRRPFVIRPEDANEPQASPGMDVRHLLDADGCWMGWTGRIRNDAGDVSAWHHHGGNDTFVYVIRGSVTVESGPGGADRIEVSAGDFFVVPAGAIHRERTSPESDLDAFVVRVGGEPELVEVDGPEVEDR